MSGQALLTRSILCASIACCGPLHAIELAGVVEARVLATDAQRSWTREGLDKSRFDRDSGPIRLGYAFLRLDADLLDAVTARVVASASDDRRALLDINEAWLGWNPVPSSPWKVRARLGAFFPAMNLEIDYESIGWTPARTISSSAINAWIGEEFRTQGLELSIVRKGNAARSPHDFGFSAALFGRNDPAGTLLAWRGWSIGDRITGLTEPVRLADLPVYRPSGALTEQARSLHIAREIDHRVGYYAAAHYGHGAWLGVDALRYDNRGDPRVVRNGQYSWNTRFDHVSVRLEPGGRWTWLAQALRGETLMGPNAVRLRYDAGYVLASHPLGPGHVTMRFDRFRAREHPADVLPSDPNGEHGRGLALAYFWRIDRAVEGVVEALEVRSVRASRTLFGAVPDRTERSLTAAIRWRF